MGRERIERGDEIRVCPWGWLYPSLNETALSYDTLTERERETELVRERGDPVASRQVSDSFGMLVGYSATMPSSFQSSIKEDACP